MSVDTSRCCRKWFSIIYTKRKLRNCEWPLKLLGGKNQHLLGKLIFENLPNPKFAKFASDVHDRFKVIKIFYLFLYSIEINLFGHVLWKLNLKQNNRWVKFELNYAWNINITKIVEGLHGSDICRTYLSTT